MSQISTLNRDLWKALGLTIREGMTLARDGQTWLKLFVRAADGIHADAPPDFERDLNATMAYVPVGIQVTRRWSFFAQEWVYVFADWRSGELLSEGRDPDEARAAAKALLAWKQLEAART